MSGVAVAAALIFLGITFAGGLVLLRHRAYRRRVFYDPKQSCVLGMAGPGIETISVNCGEDGFVLPESHIGSVSGLLEIEIGASIAGRLLDPAIAIRTDDFHDVQYLDRGVQGKRFLNVSRLLNSNSVGQRVHLCGHRATWRAKGARLHLCHEKVAVDDRVLVIAPHPDDAEIAAFGLYSDTRATVVTLTAGDASDRYQNIIQPWLSLSPNEVADTRVWDSLSIPQLGGVPPERAINLCMPDGRLKEMYSDPDCELRHERKNAIDFARLRRMNRSALLPDDALCSWKSLVRDLGRIIEHLEPTIVVAPHPRLDPHPDHLYATVALGQALQAAGSTTGRLFLYTVHNRNSELWPFGPAGSGVPLPSILPEDGNCASSFYSHGLSIERQRQKFIALEAMHDLRDLQWPANVPGQGIASQIGGELRGWMNGIGATPTSYLRRAVRPDELFFVTSFQDGAMLARLMSQHQTSTRAAA